MPLAQLSQLGCHTVIGIWQLKWQKHANRAPWSPSIFFQATLNHAVHIRNFVQVLPQHVQ